VRVPDFVEYLDREGDGVPPRIRFTRNGELWLTFRLVTTNPTGPQLLLVRDVTTEARLDAMRKDFVANASHELRSPLTVVSGYLDSLAEDLSLDPGWHGPVQEMRRQAERMGRIVHDLLELSRLEASATMPTACR
jgi:two-component system phosphate regulon sensor histidine kinase PhoR